MSYFLVSGPTFTGHLSPNKGRNRSRSNVFPILDMSTLSGDIREQRRKLCTIARNFACFGHNILGDSPVMLDLHYKIHPDNDHVAMFHGDRTRELGDIVAK